MEHSWTSTVKPLRKYKSRGECKYFEDVVSFAEQIVESIIQEAEGNSIKL